MINLSKEEFLKLKGDGSAFLITHKFNGDELTPVSVFYAMKGRKKFLLESCGGRFSFIGENPYMEAISEKEDMKLVKEDETCFKKGKALDILNELVDKNLIFHANEFPFTGGGIGYVAYDVIKQYEPIPDKNEKTIDIPETYLMFYKTFVAYDHFTKNISIAYCYLEDDNKTYEEVTEYLKSMEKELSKQEIHKMKETDKKDYTSNTTKEEYMAMVEKGKEYILKGDVFQVVLSQRFQCHYEGETFEIYRRLRSKNPSPYLFYIDFEDFQVIGSSPESLVSVNRGKVTTMPIAGTKRRGKDEKEDLALKEELLNDEKERAEHLMLVDLGRNDIGKVSNIGSVNIERFMEIELYSKVMHIVSKVSGTLRDDLTYLDGLKSCLPAGTLSGAPKIRAMEMIDELEKEKRGVYGGAIGYFSFNGNMDTCIAIRTVICKDNKAYVQAGAGIVYDSDPESEYLESYNKALGVLEVI